MRFWRSQAYQDVSSPSSSSCPSFTHHIVALQFFEFLDKKQGFFLERWGDAPVHSIG
jgi:hypothetical protein